jgi:hypothetical protein
LSALVLPLSRHSLLPAPLRLTIFHSASPLEIAMAPQFTVTLATANIIAVGLSIMIVLCAAVAAVPNVPCAKPVTQASAMLALFVTAPAVPWSQVAIAVTV